MNNLVIFNRDRPEVQLLQPMEYIIRTHGALDDRVVRAKEAGNFSAGGSNTHCGGLNLISDGIFEQELFLIMDD